MTSHRPSRWLAPLALLGAVLAVALVVQASTQDGESDGDSGTPSSQEQRDANDGRDDAAGRREPGSRPSTARKRRTYTVRPGDTLAVISERTGVSVEELQELNPKIDPNSLTVGDKIKLTE